MLHNKNFKCSYVVLFVFQLAATPSSLSNSSIPCVLTQILIIFILIIINILFTEKHKKNDDEKIMMMKKQVKWRMN